MVFVQLKISWSLRARCNAPRGSAYSFSFQRFAQLSAVSTLVAMVLGSSSSWAAFVTLKETEMDAIFSQDSFGATPVDIRYLPPITYVDASLLNIQETTPGNSNLFDLFNLFNSSTIHYAYFVDTVDWCSSTNTGIVGCGFQPGTDFVVESNFAAGGNGEELLAHELGHNLSLGHDGAPNNDNLMDSSINGNTTLTAAQVATILSRPSIQTDAFGKFVQIQPVLITASAVVVPEPSTALLAASLIGMLACNARRWRI